VLAAATPLYRIGRTPDPLAWPPRAFAGGGRYDDPGGEFVVLYAAEQRRGAFVETLAPFRPAVADLALAQRLPDGDPSDRMPPAGVIPATFFRRRIAAFRVETPGPWLDVRAPETHQALRSELAEPLVALGYGARFVWGDALGHDHRLTQIIARWAFDHRFQGLVYSSCHDAKLDCWALFDGAIISPVGESVAIGVDDPDCRSVAALFQLTFR